MEMRLTDKEEPKLSALDFDDTAEITLVVRVKGIQELEDYETKSKYMEWHLEGTIVDVKRENVSRRGALERAMNKLESKPSFQDVVPAP